MSPRYPKSGFTLLELLIALSLSASVMLVLSVGMHVILKDWERSSNRLDENLENALVLLQVERALEGAFPHTYLNRDENKRFILFEGDKDKLLWVSTVSPGRSPGLTGWQLSPSEEKTGLEIRIMPAFASNPTENLKKVKPTVVFEGYQVHFEYLYIDKQFENEFKWLEKWPAEDNQSLPHAVRMVLEAKDSKKAGESLEMIAVIRANEHETIQPVKPQ